MGENAGIGFLNIPSSDIPFLVSTYNLLSFGGIGCVFCRISTCGGITCAIAAGSGATGSHICCTFTGCLHSRLLFPMERFKATVRVNPGRFLGSINNEWGNDYNQRTDDEHGEPYSVAAC